MEKEKKREIYSVRVHTYTALGLIRTRQPALRLGAEIEGQKQKSNWQHRRPVMAYPYR